MGNESSNRKVRNQPTTIIKPILRNPNVYPTSYISQPYYSYPGYIENYPMIYNGNYNQVGYESQLMTEHKLEKKHTKHHDHHHHRSKERTCSSPHQHHPHCSHHRHHHHHSQRRRNDHGCQTSPSLLLGVDGVVEKPRYTPPFLRDISSSSSSSSIDECTSALLDTTSARNSTGKSSVIIRSTVLAPPMKDPQNVSQSFSTTAINIKKTPVVKTNHATKNIRSSTK